MIARVALVALQGVATHIGRSLLTALSLFVGVLAVVVIGAGGSAAEQAVLAGSVLSSGGPVTVRMLVEPEPQAYERAERLCASVDAALEPLGGAGALAASGSVKVNGRVIEAMFTTADVRDVLPFPIRAGRWLASEPVAPIEVVANEAAATLQSWSPGSVAIAEIGGIARSVRVVGVVFDGWSEARCFIALDPESAWGTWLARKEPVTVLAHAPGGDIGALSGLLQAEYMRAFDSPSPPNAERSDPAEPEGRVLSTITLVFSVVAGLSLVVGALGILNIGLATLKERSDELSLRRSFGATRTEVVITIMTEGQMVALSAAVLAVAAAWLVFPAVVAYLTSGVMVTAVSFDSGAALRGVAVSCAAALLGSAAPAIRAGKVAIASIMRV